jgi:hypothetical protein
VKEKGGKGERERERETEREDELLLEYLGRRLSSFNV